MLILLSGSSGVGKSTIIKKLIEQEPSLQLFKTCTTRPRRKEEIVECGAIEQLIPYNFLNEQEFAQLKDDNAFIESERIHGFSYGTLRSSIEALKTQQDFIKDIDVKGFMNLSNLLPDNITVLSIYIYTSTDTLKNRLSCRGEPADRIAIRLGRMSEEDSYREEYQLSVRNNDADFEQVMCVISTMYHCLKKKAEKTLCTCQCEHIPWERKPIILHESPTILLMSDPQLEEHKLDSKEKDDSTNTQKNKLDKFTLRQLAREI